MKRSQGSGVTAGRAYDSWVDEFNTLMTATKARDEKGTEIGMNVAFGQLLERTQKLALDGSELFMIGNGASASMASHIAADLGKNGCIRTRTFTDLSLLTALVNDCGVKEMFAAPLRVHARRDDMLVAISSSGNSDNIINAVNVARSKGMFIVTLTGMSSENTLCGMGHVNVHVPAESYGMVESIHAALLHFWVDSVLEVDVRAVSTESVQLRVHNGSAAA